MSADQQSLSRVVPVINEMDLDRLEELAKAATPGPYIRYGTRRKLGDEDCIPVGPDGYAIAFLPIGQPRDHAGAFCDGAFFAALNPATVLSLIAAARAPAPDPDTLSEAVGLLREAVEEAAITLAMLKRNVTTEITRHDGLYRWEGVPEAIQARIEQAERAMEAYDANTPEVGK